MADSHSVGVLLATVSKHEIGGIVGIVVGVILVIFGWLRVMAKAAGAILIPIVGLIVILLGVLLYTHVIKS